MRLLLLCMSMLVFAHASGGPTAMEQKLFDHVRNLGGLMHFTVGYGARGIRGCVATRDITAGEDIMAIPLETAAVHLKHYDFDAFAAEYAYDLIINRAKDPYLNTTFELYWATLPEEGEVFSGELFESHHLKMLGSDKLEDLVGVQKQIVETVYDGSLYFRPYVSLPAKLGVDKAPSLDQFKHFSTLIGSRDFSTELRPGEKRNRYFLVPVADLINHADTPNGYRYDNLTHLKVQAVTDIKKGEEITNSYQPGINHRDDLSLIIYGFIQKNDLLPATDLPDYTADNPYRATNATDEFTYGPKGYYNTREEYDRLAGLLYDIPSSDQEDAALLASYNGNILSKLVRCSGIGQKILGSCGPKLPKFGWKEAMLVEFRMHRRSMIRKSMQLIKVELDKEKAIRIAKQKAMYSGGAKPAESPSTAEVPVAPVRSDDPYGDPDEL